MKENKLKVIFNDIIVHFIGYQNNLYLNGEDLLKGMNIRSNNCMYMVLRGYKSFYSYLRR